MNNFIEKVRHVYLTSYFLPTCEIFGDFEIKNFENLSQILIVSVI